MSVTETLGALGSWGLQLADDTPDEVLRQLSFFGHVVILRGDVDVTQASTTALLRAAQYVGVLREKPTDARSLEGSGMRFWLGDEDNKGKVRETPLDLTGKTLPQCVPLILPPAVHTGTINTAAGTYTGVHQWETPRQTLDTVTTAFGMEYRVNGDATVDVGTQAQLYRATPNTILSARGAGADLDVASIGTDFQPRSSAVDYTTRAVLLGQTTDDKQIVEASADAPTVPFLDPWGNPVAFTRMISDSGQTTGSADAEVHLQLNRFNRTTQAIKVSAEDYEIQGNVVVGDNAWVYDPDNGIVDPSHELDFHGEKINPAIVRISAATWPVTEGHTVCFRTGAGAIVDLTRYVVWETGTTDITIGDLPKSLTSPGNPAQDRAQSAPDASVPNPPTGLELTTTSVESSIGQSTATITASWTAPATNTDGSVLRDLSYYLVQYRWHGRAPLWTTLGPVPVTTVDIPGLPVGLLYDVQVAAVDTTDHVSDFTPIKQITSAPDRTAPNAPSDPVVTNYLGLLRIYWDGKDNTGQAMPPDFAIVEVHVSATSGFTPSQATLVDELSTAGYANAQAPYSVTPNRFVKLVAVDNSENRSSPSGEASGKGGWVNTPDYANLSIGNAQIADLSVAKLTAGIMTADVVMSGRFTTALTGARVEHNSLGIQGFTSDGVTKWLSLTPTESLLTGTFKTAASGRRVEIGAGGAIGHIDFYAPDGTLSYVRGYTASGGTEGVQMAVPVSGTNDLWNALTVQKNELVGIFANQVQVGFGGTTGPTGLFAVSYFKDKGTPGSAFPGTSGQAMFQVDRNGVLAIDQTGKNTFHVGGSGGTGNSASFYPNGNFGTARFDLVSTATGDTHRSPSIQFVTQSNVGARINFGDGGEFDFFDPSESFHVSVAAGAYQTISDSRTKDNIRALAVDPLDVLTGDGMEVVTFRRKAGANQRPPKAAERMRNGEEQPDLFDPPAPDYDEIGVRAENAPNHIRRVRKTTGLSYIDIGSTLFLVVAAVQGIVKRLEALEGKAAA